MATITFYGGALSVTGANYLIKTKQSQVVVDCGLLQGGAHCPPENYSEFPYNVASLDAVLVTHAHIDHVGRLPKLAREGLSAPIYATLPTTELAPIMLADSQELIQEECGDKRGVLYTVEDVDAVTELFRPVGYNEMVQVTPDIRVRFRDAGHILGSASIEVWVTEDDKETKIVFSGDIGNPPMPLLAPIDYIEDADYALIETAYGNRVHENRDARQGLLEGAIKDVIAAGGVLMVPTFAIERTQEILSEINHLVESSSIPPVQIFLDSPLAIEATGVYRRSAAFLNEETKQKMAGGDDVFDFPRLAFTATTEQSKAINEFPAPKIILAGAGMSTGGRILHHELRYLPSEKNMILFIGYQAQGTLGRKILDGATAVTIFGETVPVRASVRFIEGYSAHADQNGLLEWLTRLKSGGSLKKVFCVQGDEDSSREFAALATEKLGLDAHAPSGGESFEF